MRLSKRNLGFFELEQKQSSSDLLFFLTFASSLAVFILLLRYLGFHYGMVCLVASLIPIVFVHWLRKWIPFSNTCAHLFIDEDAVSIFWNELPTQRFHFEEIESVSIDFRSYRYLFSRGSLLNRDARGNNNILTFKMNNEEVTFFLCLREHRSFKEFQACLLQFYLAGVPVKESVMDSKSYGLKWLRYDEIQVFKSRYLAKDE